MSFPVKSSTVMGGENCGVVSCPLSRNTANRFISFHNINAIKDVEWQKKMKHSLGRDFGKEGGAPKHLYICSRHFTENCIRAAGRRRYLVPGSLPTKFMPETSHPAQQHSRKPPMPRKPQVEPERVFYFDYADFLKCCGRKMVLPEGWLMMSGSQVSFWKDGLKVDVDNNLNCSVLKDQRKTQYPFDLGKSGLKQLLTEISGRTLCTGLHDVAEIMKPEEMGKFVSAQSVFWSSECIILALEGKELCTVCALHQRRLKQRRNRKDSAQNRHLSRFTPLKWAAKRKLVDAVRHQRQALKKLKKRVDRLQQEEQLDVNEDLHKGLESVVEQHIGSQEQFYKLFWKEQQKMRSTSDKGHRWHPMMLRYAILLHSQSPAAYRTLRDTGVLKLPCETTLRDYTNEIHPQAGFNPAVIRVLKDAAAKLPSDQRFVSLMHDEMSIKADLVFDQRSGELVGFFNPPESGVPLEASELASHVLVFYVVGLNNSISSSLGFFPTRNVSASDLYAKMWLAIYMLEMVCGLKVITATSDKAAANQSLIHMQTKTDGHKTRNLFALDRFVYFISDVPHLLKTLRNNLESSKSDPSSARHLWNGQSMLWEHVWALYKADIDLGLRRTRLTYEHVRLTSQSRMRVYLAAQVFSATVSCVMSQYGPPGSGETANFLKLSDKMFDCLNGISLSDKKPDRRGYTSVDDPRFEFLQKTYLGYLEEWKARTLSKREEGLTVAQCNRLFLSPQTYDGIKTTILSFVEATRYLLQNGCKFVLPRKMSQDPLEEHFGRHRQLARRCINPSLYSYGYQDNKLRLQRSLAMQMRVRGNTRGAKREKSAIQLSDSPMKKRKRTR